MSMLSILTGQREFIPPVGIARQPHHFLGKPRSPAQLLADEMKRGKNNNMNAVERGVETRKMILDYIADNEMSSIRMIADGVTAAGYKVSTNTVIKHVNKLIDMELVEKANGDPAKNLAAVYWVSEGDGE